MDLVSLVVVLIIVGVLLRLINVYIPMEARIKQILNIVVIIAVIMWVLNGTGILGALPRLSVGTPSVPPQAAQRPSARVPALAGVYRGRLTEIKGSRQSEFDLDLGKEPGTLVVHDADPKCKNATIGKFSTEAESVKLETMDVARGCERSFAFKVIDSGMRLTGTMRYEESDWDAIAERR